MTLTWIGLLVLSIVASPLTAWRLALVWSMGGLARVRRSGSRPPRSFFALDLPPLDRVARGDRDRRDRVVVRAAVRPGGAAGRACAAVA